MNITITLFIAITSFAIVQGYSAIVYSHTAGLTVSDRLALQLFRQFVTDETLHLLPSS